MCKRGQVCLSVVMLVALALSGCRTAQRPALELVDAAVTEQTAEGTRLELAMRVSNSSAVMLPLPQVRYRVTVEDAGTFEVVDDPAVALPPGESRVLTLPVAFAANERDLAGRRFEARGLLSYRPPGQFRTLLSQYRIPLPVTPFAFEGDLREADDRVNRQANDD